MSISRIVLPPRPRRDEGWILTPDGLHFICEANGYDPKKTGRRIVDAYRQIDLDLKQYSD